MLDMKHQKENTLDSLVSFPTPCNSVNISITKSSEILSRPKLCWVTEIPDVSSVYSLLIFSLPLSFPSSKSKMEERTGKNKMVNFDFVEMCSGPKCHPAINKG